MNYRERLLEEGWMINHQQEDENGISVVASYASFNPIGNVSEQRTVQLSERRPGMDLNIFWERFYNNCRQSLQQQSIRTGA